MQKVDVDDIEPDAPGGADLDRRALADPLGTTDVAMNYYALDPGEGFSGEMHAHLDQEEVFYVLEGTATFETKQEPTDESETVEVSAGQAIRFAPGEFQVGRNETDDRLVALALGAPRESREGRLARPCPECGDSDVLAVVVSDAGPSLECPECGAEMEPEM